MKKTIFIIAAIIFSTTVQAQTKDKFDKAIETAKVSTDLRFANSGQYTTTLRLIKDTLVINDSAFKFIKVGDVIVPTKLVKNAFVIITHEDVSNFINGIQEYPAKIANPFTQYFLKFFNLIYQEQKKQ